MTRLGLRRVAVRGASIRVASLGLVLAFGGGSLPACGSDHRSEPDRGAARVLDAGNVIHHGPESLDAGGADADTDTGTGADAGSPAVDPTLACIEYIRGQCERSMRCNQPGESPDICTGINARHCPDVMYAPGSTRTPEQVLACANDWRELPCDAALGRPECATPGTRARGEPCFASMQCASLVCTAYGDSCGFCAEVVSLDAACDEAAGLYCPDYYYCSEGACVPTTPSTPLALGEECEPNASRCGRNDCRADTEGVNRCQPYPTLGQSCSEHLTCAYGNSYCSPDHVCSPLPAIGESCGPDAASGAPRWCESGAFCSDAAPQPGVCEALPGSGEECSSLCTGDYHCMCSDDICATRHCMRWRYPGESCTGPGDSCVASHCEDGVCSKATESGAFDRVCGADAGTSP